MHLAENGFQSIRSCTYDELVPYTHESWRGRIRASAGIAASLSPAQVDDFDRELKIVLQNNFNYETLYIPHRIFIIHGNKNKN